MSTHRRRRSASRCSKTCTGHHGGGECRSRIDRRDDDGAEEADSEAAGAARVKHFSLVVPTLRRAGTLEHTLTTLQTQPAAEIVVQNNGNDPSTRSLVESL